MALVVCGASLAHPGQPTDTEISNTIEVEPVIVPEQQPQVVQQEEPKKPRTVIMNVSAYTVEEGNGDGLTASGLVGTPYLTCASDDLPFGTRLRINGQMWVVQDRFGGGYSNRLDLLMDTRENCFEWGRQYIEVEILED